MLSTDLALSFAEVNLPLLDTLLHAAFKPNLCINAALTNAVNIQRTVQSVESKCCFLPQSMGERRG